jgi:hypothetical protein
VIISQLNAPMPRQKITTRIIPSVTAAPITQRRIRPTKKISS